MKRFRLIIVLIAVFAVMAFRVDHTKAQDRTQEVLGSLRAALGGEEKLKALQSLSMSAKFTRSVKVANQTVTQQSDGELEMDFMLPDKFLKSETSSMFGGAGEVTRISGFDGDQVVEDTKSPATGGMQIMSFGGPARDDPAARLPGYRAECARYLLAWFATSSPSFPLEYSYVGEAKSKDGEADVIEAKGPNGFVVRLFVDKQSHRPLMLTYRGASPRPMMRQIGGGGAPVDIEKLRKEAPPAPPQADIQVFLADYKAVDGILLPHTISRSADGELFEKMEIKKFKVNPALKADKFKKK